MKRFLSILTILVVSALVVFSQNSINASNNSVLVDEKKTAVYLEFVKTGVCNNGNYLTVIRVSPCEKKSETDQELQAVWVKLVNNTRWAISTDVQKLAIPPLIYPIELSNKQTVTAAKDSAEFDVIYDVESETGCDFGIEAPKGQVCARRETPVPNYNRRGASSTIFIPSGQSIIYAINQEHLKKYLTTYIFYNYEWEISKSGQPSPPRYDSQHRLYFSWYDLEAGIKKNQKTNQNKAQNFYFEINASVGVRQK